MQCPLCGHAKAHKHGSTSKGSQRYNCPNCKKTFTDTFDTLYYRRQITPEEAHTILQSHAEGSSLRGIARIGKRAYGTVVSLVKMASQKAQLVHNQALQAVETEAIVADELWSFIKKNRNNAYQKNLMWAIVGLV